MKKYSIFLLSIICILLLVSCGKKDEIVAEELASQINKRAAFSETLTELDKDGAEKYFVLNPNDYSEITAYVGTKAVCDEFAVIKTNNTDAVIDKLKMHIEQMRDEYAKYRPEQADKLNNVFMAKHDGTVVMIVSSDKSLAETIYSEYLK